MSFAIGFIVGAASFKAAQFARVMWQYRVHSISYAARSAWRIAIKGWSF